MKGIAAGLRKSSTIQRGSKDASWATRPDDFSSNFLSFVFNSVLIGCFGGVFGRCSAPDMCGPLRGAACLLMLDDFGMTNSRNFFGEIRIEDRRIWPASRDGNLLGLRVGSMRSRTSFSARRRLGQPEALGRIGQRRVELSLERREFRQLRMAPVAASVFVAHIAHSFRPGGKTRPGWGF